MLSPYFNSLPEGLIRRGCFFLQGPRGHELGEEPCKEVLRQAREGCRFMLRIAIVLSNDLRCRSSALRTCRGTNTIKLRCDGASTKRSSLAKVGHRLNIAVFLHSSFVVVFCLDDAAVLNSFLFDGRSIQLWEHRLRRARWPAEVGGTILFFLKSLLNDGSNLDDAPLMWLCASYQSCTCFCR